MILKDEALLDLFDDSKYNFVDFLQNVSSCYLTETADVQQIINTFELFAFGDWRHYLKYQAKFIHLPSEGVRKLAKLTLISCCNENEGSVLPTKDLVHSLDLALRELTAGDQEEALETLLISMVDEGLIDARIDERRKEVHFLTSHVQRDAYNPSTCELRVLDEHTDIPKRSVSLARAALKQWLDQQITPARALLQELE